MRLTLRTLLAYLDDVLDPADKEELSQKIESSEFAEDLVHRTRDTMRRLRLSAPQMIGTGMGLDPNTVAEYLDNVLAPEQVGDFERICLESDVHLAEAAACHHVLTMVLGEPADVEPRARQRMYQISTEARERKRHRAEPAHGLAVGGGGAKPQAAAASISPAAAVEIPEYLRTGSWWQSRGALMALAVVLLLAIVLMLGSGVMGWFGKEPALTALSEEPGEAAAPDTTAQTGAMDGGAAAATSPPLGSPPPPVTPGIGPPPTETPVAAADKYAPAPSAETNVAIGEQDSASETPRASDAQLVAPEVTASAEVIEASSPDAPPAADDPSVVATPPVEDVPLAAALAPEAAPSVDATEPVAEATSPTEPTEPAVVEPVVVPDAPADDEISTGPAELGTYLSSKTVLLRYDDAAGAWFRMEPRQAVVAGQRLLALPEFRPTITLASGVQLVMSGGTQVALAAGSDVQVEGMEPAGAEVPAVELVYGRIILINTSNRENQLRLIIGPSVADARLARNATLGIEVERQYVPGHDPRQSPAPVLVRVFAPEGGVEWQDAAGAQQAAAASRWTIAEGVKSEMAPDASPPEWIIQEPVVNSSEQQLAAPRVESALVSNQPADIQLLELFQSNVRREMKSLVTRASIHVGLFEPFVSALRDSGQRWPTWKTHIQTLRAAMALSPESAEKVRQTLIQQRGERAAGDLYEMLCGYNADTIGRTPEQWKTGALAKLIDWLEEDSLDYRVLAVYNLLEITEKQFMSDPAANARERAKNVRIWRSRLESGELRPLWAVEAPAGRTRR